MTFYPSPVPPDYPDRKNRKKLWIILVFVALFLVLMVSVPELFIVLGTLAILVAIVGLVFGKLPWLRVRGRKGYAAILAGAFALTFVSGAVSGAQDGALDSAVSAPVAFAPITTSSESPTAPATPAAASSPVAIADFENKPCDGDQLVMEQSADKLYCDNDSHGALVWTNQQGHDRALSLAKQASAEKKAAEEAAAEKKAAEEIAAEKKAAEEIAAKKKATEAAATNKKIVERQAELEAAAKKKTAQKAAQERQEKAEAKAARLAEEKAEQETYIAPRAKAYYANCTAVRAAGADPIYSGDPGYSRKLDRDGDGVACE